MSGRILITAACLTALSVTTVWAEQADDTQRNGVEENRLRAVTSVADEAAGRRPQEVAAPPTAADAKESRPMLQRLSMAVPDWTYEAFRRLEEAGVLPEKQRLPLYSLQRREGAMLTARAAAQMQVKTPSDEGIRRTLAALQEEFADELAALGDGSKEAAASAVAENASFWDWRVGGEVRYSYVRNSGSPGLRRNDNRWRFRLETVKAVSEHWRIRLLGASETSRLSGADSGPDRHPKQGKPELSRLYGQGSYRWYGRPMSLEVGKAYAFLGDGHVLDTTFEGGKIAFRPTAATQVYAGVGDVDETERMYFAEGRYSSGRTDYMGGWYRWHNYGEPVSIYGAGVKYYMGNYRLGAVYLAANRADGSGDRDGYALELRYGRNYSWMPGTYEAAFMYYDLAGKTYVSHTMYGMGNRMDGFSGWGAKAYYTLNSSLMVGMHYYSLKDSTDHRRGRTWWSECTFSF